uniref:Uncharacterized protein n=1 Tax=Candidatus Kentrum sp. LFY TaxID=2126342 RepID=A0A450WIF6_9GAMM|nr:MAG: hypothetical protein BECKLFY1418C_GA0070996_102613 [Candidatus Kentron sp. LFY]
MDGNRIWLRPWSRQVLQKENRARCVEWLRVVGNTSPLVFSSKVNALPLPATCFSEIHVSTAVARLRLGPMKHNPALVKNR